MIQKTREERKENRSTARCERSLRAASHGNQPCEQQVMERRRRKKVREKEEDSKQTKQTKSHHNCTFTDAESCTVSHYPTLNSSVATFSSPKEKLEKKIIHTAILFHREQSLHVQKKGGKSILQFYTSMPLRAIKQK